MSDAPSGLRPIAPPATDGVLAKEYAHIDRTMIRCERAVRAFDAKAYDARAVESARAMWKTRILSEYRSTSVFSAMVAQLMEARASLEATAVVLRMGQDEVRHAAVCAEALAALGGDPRLDVPVDVAPLARHPGCGPEERALRNVIYGCAMSEIVNTARFVDALDTMSDPFLKDVTRQLLSDEVLHGQFGFHYLDEWNDWLEARPEVRASLARYLRHAFVVLERQLSGVGAPARVLTDDERALGLPDPARLPETFYATIEAAVVPGLERYGIEAGQAWRERRLEERAT
jgi:hypothetical protein